MTRVITLWACLCGPRAETAQGNPAPACWTCQRLMYAYGERRVG